MGILTSVELFNCHSDYSLTEHEDLRRDQESQENVRLNYLLEWQNMLTAMNSPNFFYKDN